MCSFDHTFSFYYSSYDRVNNMYYVLEYIRLKIGPILVKSKLLLLLYYYLKFGSNIYRLYISKIIDRGLPVVSLQGGVPKKERCLHPRHCRCLQILLLCFQNHGLSDQSILHTINLQDWRG